MSKGHKHKSRTAVKNKPRPWLYAGLAVIAVLVVWVLVRPTAAPDPTAVAQAEQIALGKTVYAQQCAACHGLNLEGQPDWQTPNADGTFRAPPHDATGHTWHHGDDYLFARTKYGTADLPPEFQNQSNMPAYETILTDDEILAVLAYIKNAWPAQAQQSQQQATAQETQ